MNILQILPSLDVGGVETGTVDLARYLVAHGHKAITVSGGGRLVRELDMPMSRHYTLPAGKKSPLSVLRMIGELKSIIRREDIDIVHARSRVPALIGYFAARSSRRVFVTTAHGYYGKHVMSVPMSWGKFVIVASNVMAKHMMSNFGVPAERIRLIPRGVDLDRFRYMPKERRPGQEFVIGMVSRITPLKGHADFIRAVSMLARRIPRIKALIVGDAPKPKYKEGLELIVRRLGLAGTVEFVRSTGDVPSLMRTLDLLVSATVTPEAFGRVIIEANASGVPVVATRVGGIVDIIEDGKNGFLCGPGDPKDMADRIFTLYKDPKLAASMAGEAHSRVKGVFNLEKMMQRTISVYEEALAVQNILVIKMTALGDVILSVPSLRAIRAKFPASRIKVLVDVGCREALDGCPYINEMMVCDLKEKDAGIKGLWMVGRRLRAESFDSVIDLQNNKASHILSFLTMAGSRYGYDNGKLSFLLNRTVKDDAPHLDPIEHQARTLGLLGIKNTEKRLEIWPAASASAAALRLLKQNWAGPSQPLFGINVRASGRWVSKNWPPKNIAELCDRAAKQFGARAVLTGAYGDAEYAQDIAKMTRSKPIIAAGRTTVSELAAMMKHFRVYITPDSAPMHIAAATGTPLVALFGPTDQARHMVPADNATVISMSRQAGCGPCYSPVCRKRSACMKGITVDEVLSAMNRYMAQEGVSL